MGQEPRASISRVSNAKSRSAEQRQSRCVERLLEQNRQVEPLPAKSRRESQTPGNPPVRPGIVILDQVVVEGIAAQSFQDPAFGENGDAGLPEVRSDGAHGR